MKRFVVLALLLLLISCSPKNPVENGSIDSKLFITEFSGEKNEHENSTEYTYIQRINWDHDLEEIPLFAYSITTSDNELPEGICTNPDGWVYHYLSEADESIPLSQSEEKTIWTDQTSIEFSFESSQGELSHIITGVEVKYLLNEFESEPVSASYFDSREIGTCLTNSVGDCAGQIIGTGTTFLLNEKMFDIFVEGFYADHFMYRINVVAEGDSSIIEEGDWQNSINCPNIRRVEFSPENDNALVPNEPGEITQLEAYVVTLSGYANSDNPSELYFKVQEGFYPNTLIYNGIEQSGYANSNAVFGLGEHHFTTYFDECFGQELPHQQINGELRVATAYWIDQDGNNTFIGSDDFRLYLQYGWSGEYYNNSPYSNLRNLVFDEQTGMNYFSTIEYMDLRLDDQPLEHNDLPASIYNIVDDDGTEWLRVPISHEVSHKIMLENLSYGEHTFTARAVDMQIAVDETPSSFTFTVYEPISAEDKEGVLILDLTLDSPLFSPEDYIDDFYYSIFSDYSGTVDCLDQHELQNSVWIPYLHFSKDVFAATDLQPYELLVIHSDDANGANNLAREYDVLNICLEQGCNILISAGKNIQHVQYHSINLNFPLLEKYFGIPLEQDVISTVMFEDQSADWLHLQFFDRAMTTYVYNDDLQLLLPGFNTLMNNAEGLGPIAIFTDFDPFTEPIFAYGVKTPQAGTSFTQWDDIDDDDEFPSLDQYNYYNGAPVGLRKLTAENKCYIFGFPLSYMVLDDVTDLMNQLLNEMGM